jgi:hypothetical protein
MSFTGSCMGNIGQFTPQKIIDRDAAKNDFLLTK